MQGRYLMVPQNTRESAVRREQFHDALRDWLDESFENTVGDAQAFGGSAWLWVRHGGGHFYLNAESSRAGVRRYLQLVDSEDGNPEWTMSSQDNTDRARVAIGPKQEVIDGFSFYRHIPER